MVKFNLELLKQKNAQLNALLFQNTYLNIPETLFYAIQIELEDFEIENTLVSTTISLNSIRLNISSIKDLKNRIFEFPINPTEGYIDGSVYLFDVHNPFDVKKIEFKNWDDGFIDATICYDIDFEFENTGYEKITDRELKVRLTPGQLSIDQEIMTADNFDATKVKNLVSKFVLLDDYQEPEISEGRVIFKMPKVGFGTIN